MKVFDNKYLRSIIYLIQMVMTIVFIYMTYQTQLIPMRYIIYMGIVLGGLLIGEIFLIFHKKSRSKRSMITQLLSIVLSSFMVVGSFYVYKAAEVVDLLATETFQKRAISVVVLKDSKIKNKNQLEDKKIGYVSSINIENMSYAIGEIQHDVGNIKVADYKDFKALIKDFYDEKIDALILDEAFRSLVVTDHAKFSDDTRVVYQITKDEESVSAKNVDVTQNPFLVFVSGNDEYGDLSAVSRTDVNMLVGINPQTKQILLISIPRDTYYPLHTSGQLDKFTHSGIYGLQESIDTLQDLIHEDINYYVRLNFTSFIDIVDALGGITVYSPEAFTTKIGKYEIKEGKNVLNAKEALSFVRERKSFIDGDFARGRNQQRMISAIVKKVCSPAILTSFSEVLDTVSRCVEMNFSSQEINSLVQLQLTDMPKWDIQSYQIVGTPNSLPCYSSGGTYASVVEPSQESIEQATAYIDQLMAGEIIETETGDFDQ